MQAIQCAMSANVAIRSKRTAAPYSEYLSIFLATRTNLKSRAVFKRPINVVVWKIKRGNRLLEQNENSSGSGC